MLARVERQSLFEQTLLAAEAVIQARAADPHRFGQIRDAGAGVTARHERA